MTTSNSITDKKIPGGWTQRPLNLAGRSFSIVMPADPDEASLKMEELLADEEQLLEPYWTMLWSAALNTAEYLLRRAPWPAGTRVLEIGCGIGVVGLAALARGLEVTFSDYVPDAVALALENARRNRYENAQAEIIDWRSPPGKKYSVIVASDILYDKGHHTAIFQLLDRMLADDGDCWIGDSGRSTARAFLEQAAERGYAVQLRNATGGAISFPTTRQFQMLELKRLR